MKTQQRAVLKHTNEEARGQECHAQQYSPTQSNICQQEFSAIREAICKLMQSAEAKENIWQPRLVSSLPVGSFMDIHNTLRLIFNAFARAAWPCRPQHVRKEQAV